MMKKTFLNKWVIFMPLVAAVCFSACKKEVADSPTVSTVAHKSSHHDKYRPFKMSSETFPRINPIAPFDLKEPAGMKGYANAVGWGKGNATYMGKIKNWFNQLAYSPTGADPTVGTTLAPIVDALKYPVLGGPLPLIQKNDFKELRKANKWLKIPVSINGMIVNSVVYNDKGDALFTSLTTDAKLVFVSPTRINFSAQGKFVGGRGKFVKAKGTYTQTGYFNPQNFNDAEYHIDGKITY